MKKIIFIILALIIIASIVSMYIFRDRFGQKENVNVVPDVTQETPVEKEIVYPEWYETDKDGDGIRDEQEAELGTDLYASDTDGDGISDIVEIEQYKTDPTNPDTDGDGYWDAIEILNGYNPNGEGTL